MDNTQLKARIFDAEQALRWLAEAVEENDLAAAGEACSTAMTALGATAIEIDRAKELTRKTHE